MTVGTSHGVDGLSVFVQLRIAQIDSALSASLTLQPTEFVSRRGLGLNPAGYVSALRHSETLTLLSASTATSSASGLSPERGLG
jgi:hypothetical protein